MDVNWNLPAMVDKAYAPLFTSRARYISIKGSRGSGKSEAVARKVIYDVITKPYVNWLVVRRFANTNRQSTYTLIEKVANVMGVGGLFKFNSSLPEITYKATGQKIIFRGLDKPLSITSISVQTGNLCRMWTEEAYQVESEEAFNTVDESLRGKINDPDGFYQTVLTFNPWNEHHWLKPKFFDEDTREDNTLAYTTTYKNNPFLDDGYIKKLKDMLIRNPRRAKVAVLGEWGVAEGLVFNNFDTVEFDINKKIQEIGTTVHGMDFGFTHDPTTLPSAVYDDKNHELWIYDELYKTGLLSDQIVREIKKRNLMAAKIHADAASAMTIAELKHKGVRRIRGAKKGPDSIELGISFMQSLKIHIHPKCVHTIEEFNTYCFDKDKGGNWLNQPIDDNNHIIDAIGYSLEDYYASGGNKAKVFKNTFI
ncbi:PBSX family phage terminase large subunit [Pediococcus acidilactici]|uniref:PBSX family phage terminase large subunit n=1 Tax=Pediococcus acidilactici TaxID=1254 RepID=UPI001914D373|nr:PBSX family phage terminase large subunit [Pediococcus acidilactici]QQP83918.1 PBSX family phage terminase large subunit [Pediococcus acidilactici]